MKRLLPILWLSVAIAHVAFADVASAQTNERQGKVIVRSLHGNIEYSQEAQWRPLKTNLELSPGASIRTSSNSECYLQVNGFTSTVKVCGATTVNFQEKTMTGGFPNGESQTILDLKSGMIQGSVRKLSAASSFKVLTPNGTMAVRGTDFAVSAEPLPAGGFRVTFTSVTGTILCSAMVGGKLETQSLQTGQSWTPGAPPRLVVSGPPLPRYSGKELENIQQMAERYNSFGFQLFDATRQSHSKENVFISPLGVALTLSIMQNGAQGPTRQEITRVLGVDSLTPAEIGNANKLFVGQLSSLDENIRLEIANSLWIDHDFAVKTSFISLARDFYDAEVATLDFANPASVGKINSWAGRHTHGTIPTILDTLQGQTALVAVDAVYFKGHWESEFEKSRTSNKPFKLTGGPKISHPRMSQSGQFLYYETRSFQLISLSYYGGARMDILLPKGSLDSVLKNLSDRQWEGWISKTEYRDGLIELPRFKFDTNYDLKAPLASLGIRQAFHEKRADFSQMGDSISLPLYVGEIEQKTHLDVDEEGTVAAAVTASVVSISSAINVKPPPPPFKMIVDHPFFVVIRENSTGANLFMGAILDPR